MGGGCTARKLSKEHRCKDVRKRERKDRSPLLPLHPPPPMAWALKTWLASSPAPLPLACYAGLPWLLSVLERAKRLPDAGPLYMQFSAWRLPAPLPAPHAEAWLTLTHPAPLTPGSPPLPPWRASSSAPGLQRAGPNAKFEYRAPGSNTIMNLTGQERSVKPAHCPRACRARGALHKWPGSSAQEGGPLLGLLVFTPHPFAMTVLV